MYVDTTRSAIQRATQALLLVILTSLAAPALAQPRIEAYSGQPFGVGRVTVPLPQEDAATADTNGFELVAEDGRVLYPAFDTGGVLNLVLNLLGGDEEISPSSVTAFFLFTGHDSLELTLHTPTAHRMSVAPRQARDRHRALLRRWWERYQRAADRQETMGDYPSILETYLTTMLGERLGLTAPQLRHRDGSSGQLRTSLELLLGTESMRLRTMRDTLRGSRERTGSANLPVPVGIESITTAFPKDQNEILIEPIAMHVPRECFYIRFGRFSNYLWLTHLLEDYGGDLKGMVTLRGHDARLNDRMQRQLALRESALVTLLGEQVIADMALIGHDTYLREGAAIGILFESKNPVLGADIQRQRTDTWRREQSHGANQQTVKITGHDVSYLSTPDNRVRSFYAVDGRYHLVTTSRTIVRRFFEAGQGQEALGSSTEFRHARSVLPVDRDDTIFVYLSTDFFEGLIRPKYRIELRRRLRSVTDIEILQLARLAARAEKQSGDSIKDLVRAGLVPDGFGQRADGSQLIEKQGRVLDSLRGARGSFTPIADMQLDSVTAAESRDYEALRGFYRSDWRQMDPLMVAIKRYALDEPRRERVVIDARSIPFGPDKYGVLTAMLGPPRSQHVAPRKDDVLHAQAVVKGFGSRSRIKVHHLFFGIKDIEPGLALSPDSFIKWLQLMTRTPGYLGAWPQPGWLDLLPMGLLSEPDAEGYTPLLLGLWRRQWEEYSVLSFQREVLESLTPGFGFLESEDVAQVRIHVGNLTGSGAGGLANALSYSRSWQSSLGGARFLHALSQQLQVPPDQSRKVAERLLDARLVCSLDGKYRLQQPADGRSQWTSTAWPEGHLRRLPDDYQSPVSRWLRELEAQLRQQDDKLLVHIEIDMERKPTAKQIGVPMLNWFDKVTAGG